MTDNFQTHQLQADPLDIDPAQPSNDTEDAALATTKAAYADRLTWWLLRIFTGAGEMPVYCAPGDSYKILLAQAAGVPEIAQQGLEAEKVQAAIREAWQSHPNFSGGRPDIQPCHVQRNLDWLAQGSGLNPVERDIFELAVAISLFPVLRTAFTFWGAVTSSEHGQAVAALVLYPEPVVDQAISQAGPLYRGGLLKDPHDHFAEVKISTLLAVPRLLAHRLATNQGHPSEVMSALVQPTPKTELSLADFAHQPDHNRLAQSWLAGALTRATAGQSAGHMLVAGAPGLGKTEWVRALLDDARRDHAALPLELIVMSAEGDAVTGEERFSNLRVGLNVFSHSPGCVLMFDDADDIFKTVENTYNAEGAFSMSNHRASMNRLVETSRVPVIWIMNDPQVLHPAVLRRFDVVIRMPKLNRSTRAGLLTKRLPDAMSETELQAWSELDALTPALIDRLGVVQAAAQSAGAPLDSKLHHLWLKQRLQPGATRRLGLSTSTGAGLRWDALSVNASHDLADLVTGIQRSGSARILLHGIPGAGKTAYAHELARLLDKPLQAHRASDLLSAFVGGTEQRIAAAFEDALDADAVLFLDEADSLLSSRDRSARQWEVTQVNELLEQLGEFQGIVLLATNRLEALDTAVLRRMDIKVEFMALRPLQIRILYVRSCQLMGIVPDLNDMREAAGLPNLTPGDFACVLRRHAFAPLVGPRQLTEALIAEVALKTGNRQPIGFAFPGMPVVDPNDGDVQAVIDELCGPP